MVSRSANRKREDLWQKILIALIRSMQWLKMFYLISEELQEKKFNPSKWFLMNELYPGRNMDIPDPWAGPEEIRGNVQFNEGSL